MAPATRQHKGRDAEQRAYDYLIQRGLTPIARNYRASCGEIDLIMRERNVLVFVEVRSRASKTFGSAAETIDGRKRAKLVATAEHYLQRNAEFGQQACRFDVVAIDGEGNSLEWLQNAFELER
jgi:putative endonuclease